MLKMAFVFKEGSVDKKMEAVRKLQNDSMDNELVKARQMELSLQRCKEILMRKRKLVEESIQKRVEEVQDVATILSPARKLFDQLYGQVDEIYQLELLLLELNQKLLVAKATREEAAILNALRAASSLPESLDDVSVTEAVCPMREWYQQIACVKRDVDPDTTASTFHKAGRVHTDRVFYWVKFDASPLGRLGGHPTMTFSTRHCGICLRLCITASRQSTDGDPGCCSVDTYKVTSDLPLDDLQLSLHHSLNQRQMAHEFVIKTVWCLMEEQLVP